LVIVDLPPDDRHPLYHSDRFGTNETDRGLVRYEYRSMADLSFATDATVDLIYSGQSIEHVTESDGDIVLKESFRVLKPGGYMAIDTPNGTVCRLQQPGFIELRDKVTAAGFEVRTDRGLTWGGPAVAQKRFDQAALAAHRGIYHDAEGCYLLALLIQKPA
jgi:SAM-dependent methyltransferase